MGIFYKAIMHKQGFGEAKCKDLIKRIRTKFTSYFCDFIQFTIKFGTLNEFTGNLNMKLILENGKHWNGCGPISGLRPCGAGPVQQPLRLGEKRRVGRLGWPGPWQQPAWLTHARRRRHKPEPCHRTPAWRGGAATTSGASDEVRWGGQIEHLWRPGKPPGRKFMGGAHPWGGATWRRGVAVVQWRFEASARL
jgi:hypothetical protein